MLVKKLINAVSLIKPPLSQRVKCGLVILRKGEEIGEHTTDKKEEVIIILQGKAKIIIENEIEIVSANNLVYIPEGKRHNLINNFEEELKYVYLVSFL